MSGRLYIPRKNIAHTLISFPNQRVQRGSRVRTRDSDFGSSSETKVEGEKGSSGIRFSFESAFSTKVAISACTRFGFSVFSSALQLFSVLIKGKLISYTALNVLTSCFLFFVTVYIVMKNTKI